MKRILVLLSALVFLSPQMPMEAATAAVTATSELCPDGSVVYGALAADITDLTVTTLIAASTTKRISLIGFTVTNSNASTGTVVDIKNGSTLAARNFAASAGGGWIGEGNLPGALNTAWTATAETTGANIQVSYIACVRFGPT